MTFFWTRQRNEGARQTAILNSRETGVQKLTAKIGLLGAEANGPINWQEHFKWQLEAEYGLE